MEPFFYESDWGGSPHTLEYLECGLHWLPMNGIHIPLNNIFQLCATSRQRFFQILENLLRLYSIQPIIVSNPLLTSCGRFGRMGFLPRHNSVRRGELVRKIYLDQWNNFQINEMRQLTIAFFRVKMRLLHFA